MKDKVRIGIAGTGMIAAFHAEAIRLLEHAELSQVYDKDTTRARSFAEKFGCRASESLGDFLDSDIDIVCVTTPSGLHGRIAVPAARAGKHIFCEKPLETTPEKAREIYDECIKNNVLLSPVFPARYSLAARTAREAVRSGRFGDPVLIGASVRWYRAPEYYAESPWRGTWALDGGGALMNQGIHAADLLRYFNGEIDELTANTANRLHKTIEVEDTLMANLRFRNGSLGYLESSTACAPGYKRKITFSGTRGGFILEDDCLTHWSPGEETPEDGKIREANRPGGTSGGGADPASISCRGHHSQLEELVSAVLTGKPLETPGIEGVKTVELICAAYESARNGRTVRLA